MWARRLVREGGTDERDEGREGTRHVSAASAGAVVARFRVCRSVADVHNNQSVGGV